MNAIQVMPPQQLAPAFVGTRMNALVPNNIAEALQLADIMAKASLIPDHLRGKPGDCLLVIMQAQRWSMDAVSVAQCTSVVRGKLCYEGKLVSAALRSMGAIQEDLDFEYSGAGQHRKIVVTGTLRSGKVRSIDGTVEQWATENGNWKKNPDDMLAYRGTRQWARRWAPTAMLGIYTPDELEDAGTHNVPTVATVIPNQPDYPAADFDKNLPKWRQLIASQRRSADEVVAMVSSKGRLTQEQISKIREASPGPQDAAGGDNEKQEAQA